MKSIPLLLAILFFSITGKTQEKIDTYEQSLTQVHFNIRANFDDNNKPILFLEVFSGIRDRYYIKLDENLIQFIEAISKSKTTFLEWKQIAKDNQVEYTIKPMNILFPMVEVYEYDSFDKTYQIIERVQLLAGFCVYTYSGGSFSLGALSNVYKNRSYNIEFNNSKQFDKFITKISPESIKSKLNKRKAQ